MNSIKNNYFTDFCTNKRLLLIGLLFSIFYISSKTVKAQDQEPCGHEMYRQSLLEHQWFNDASQTREAVYQDFINLPPLPSSPPEGNYIIPVVVHILYDDVTGNPLGYPGMVFSNDENTQDQAIINAICLTNKYLAGLDGNGNQVAPDTHIELRLATIDPNGNVTTGINHYLVDYSCTGISFALPDECPSMSEIQADYNWDSNSYLNIYSVDLLYGALGFGATFVNIWTDNAGMNLECDQNSHPETFVHEVGHYLNLRHPNWGGCYVETDCATQGDFVCDTPMLSSNFAPNGCEEGVFQSDCPAETGIWPLHNFMAYSCYRYEFTPGQIDRMHVALNTDPSGIEITSDQNLIDTGTNAPYSLSCGALSVNIENITPTCTNTGSITISLNETNGSEEIHWETGGYTIAGQNDLTLSNLEPGDYVVYICNDLGNYIWTSITVPESSANAISIASDEISNATCGNNGFISVIVNGGSGSFTFLWSNGETTQNIGNLQAGDYTLIVTDNSGCVANETITVTVSEPVYDPITISQDVVNNATCGNEDGSISITISGGTGNNSFSWDNGETTQNITGLAAGEYTVTVSDDDDCAADQTAAFVVEEPNYNPIVISENTVNDATCGNSDGSIDVTITGGSGEYTYFWNGIESADEDLNGLSAGVYTLIVSDDSGCVSDEEVVITIEQSELDVIVSSTPETCIGYCDGTVSVISNGESIISFQLEQNGNTYNDNNNDLVIDGLCSGDYNLTVTSANCTYTTTVTIAGSSFTPDYTNTTLFSDVTWDNVDLLIDGDFIVSSGVLLTITNNSTIRFTANSRLIVEPNGYLDVYNSTLTSLCGYWGGVELRGNPSMPQNFSSQGVGVFVDSEISYSHTAIRTLGSNNGNDVTAQSGGMGKAVNTNFLNNVADVRMVRYINGSNMYQFSFYDCSFIVDNNYNTSVLPKDRVYLQDIVYVQFENCNFDNFNIDLLSQVEMVAIHTWSAPFNLTCDLDISDPCPEMPHINGFTRGILAFSTRAPFTHNIDRVEFNNFRNIYMYKVRNANITRNNFYNLPDGSYNLAIGNIQWADLNNYPYGVYIAPTTRFKFLQNNVNMTMNQVQGNISPASFGIISDRCGPFDNKIYKNNFTNTRTGVLALDENREPESLPESQGLNIECNTFANNSIGIDVTTYGISSFWDDEYGVKAHLGSAIQSAGNDFSNSGYGWDMRVSLNILNVSDHFYHYSFGEIDLTEMQVTTSLLTGNQNQCFDVVTTIPPGKGLMENISLFDTKQQELAQIVDGGNTQALTAEVVYSDYSEALELYYELMSKSPDLSDDVMVEAIQKEFDLPKVLLTSILASNPQAAKSKRVKEKLDARVLPLEQYQREMIKEGLTWLSYKENIEGEMRIAAENIDYAFYFSIDAILADTNIVDKKAAILNQFTNPRVINDFYYQMHILQDFNDYSAAESLLNSIESVINISDLKKNDVDDLLELNVLKEQLYLTDANSLSSSQIQTLENFKDQGSIFVSSEAEEILIKFGLETMSERLVVTSSSNNKSMSYHVGDKEKKYGYLVYPNPSTDFTFLRGNSKQEDLKVELLNLEGQVLESFEWNKQERMIDVSQFAAGWYSFKIYLNGNPITNIPLTITK